MNNIPVKVLRQMGYIRDQRGIARRYLNESGNWKTHLEKSREFVLRCMEHTKQEGATILGSGWWLDIPVDDLVRRFSPLRFVDIYHPPEIRKKAEKYPDIRLIEMDVSGSLAVKMYEAVKRRRKEKHAITDFDPGEFQPGFDPGFVVSLNLLSQLDALLTDYWTGYIPESEKDLMSFRKSLQQKHISFLLHHDACLITDTVEKKRYRHGNVTEKPLVVVPLPKSTMSEEWIWEFDTSGTYDPAAVTTFEVKAVCMVKK